MLLINIALDRPGEATTDFHWAMMDDLVLMPEVELRGRAESKHRLDAAVPCILISGRNIKVSVANSSKHQQCCFFFFFFFFFFFTFCTLANSVVMCTDKGVCCETREGEKEIQACVAVFQCLMHCYCIMCNLQDLIRKE